MRIVQITTDSRVHFRQPNLPEPYFGTAPAGLLDGFDAMEDAEVHIISCTPFAMPGSSKLGDRIWFHQPPVGKWGWGKTAFSGCIRAVRKLTREIEPDIVHGQGTERDCAMDAVLSGYPNVLTIHGNMRVHAERPEHRRNVYYKMAAALESFCLRRTDGVVAISTYTRDLVQGLARKTWILPNAVDSRFFGVAPVPPSVPRLLFVGSLDERKNPLGLVEACAPMLKTGGCTLAMAGHFDARTGYGDEVMDKVHGLPGISLLGFLNRDALAAEFARSSVLVLPTFEDNCPMVVLEAMAAGLPVAASRVGGVPDLFEHGKEGLMFNPHDQADIQSSLERLINDPAMRVRMGTAGRASAMDRFHPRKIAAAHLDIYREVLGR